MLQKRVIAVRHQAVGNLKLIVRTCFHCIDLVHVIMHLQVTFAYTIYLLLLSERLTTRKPLLCSYHLLYGWYVRIGFRLSDFCHPSFGLQMDPGTYPPCHGWRYWMPSSAGTILASFWSRARKNGRDYLFFPVCDFGKKQKSRTGKKVKDFYNY